MVAITDPAAVHGGHDQTQLVAGNDKNKGKAAALQVSAAALIILFRI